MNANTKPRPYRKLWLSLISVIALSFLVLGYFGREIYRQAPPVPKRVVTTDGSVLFTAQDIKDGQNVWQSIGGQELGTIWGHGSYVAPDWTADWLHREATWLLNRWASQAGGTTYEQAPPETQAMFRERLKKEIRSNTYHADTGDLVVSPLRAEAMQAVGAHYAALFGNDSNLKELRRAYAIPVNTIKTPERQRLMNTFFFWAAWSCGTERPGSTITYTQNWPPEALIDNRPTGSTLSSGRW
jgi:nitric oxide reductase subunit B